MIGAGVSGLAAIRLLQQLGIDFTVLERGPEAGGVWKQNRYPGAGVDTPSHLYSFSFHPRDWTMHYALQSELHEYFNDVLDGLGARDRVRFGTEVLSRGLRRRQLRVEGHRARPRTGRSSHMSPTSSSAESVRSISR